MGRYNVTTAIPYVNGRPHVGFALELIETEEDLKYRKKYAGLWKVR